MKLEESARLSTDDLFHSTFDLQDKLFAELDSLVETGKAEIELVYYSLRAGPGGSHANCGFNGTIGGGGGSSSTNNNLLNGAGTTANASYANSQSLAAVGNNNGGDQLQQQQKRLKRGKAYRLVETNEVFCFVSSDNVTYRPGGERGIKNCIPLECKLMQKNTF